jgi:hypothetical protein
LASQQAQRVDFKGKAERRGVQRAAIELALNLLATNQEQHRPMDRFRMVMLPPKYKPPQKEVQLCLPLDPWKRPVEQDPFKITKLLLKYRKWKDYAYSSARSHAIDMLPGHLEPPANYNGPCSLPSEHDLFAAIRKRHDRLVWLQAALINAGKIAPRPLIHRITTLTNEAICLAPNETHPFADEGVEEKPLESKDFQILMSLCQPSWSDERLPYREVDDEGNDTTSIRGKLNEFERDVNILTQYLPFWEPAQSMDLETADPNLPEFYIQRPYDGIESVTGVDINILRTEINKNRRSRSQKGCPVYEWTELEVRQYLEEMHKARLIQ